MKKIIEIITEFFAPLFWSNKQIAQMSYAGVAVVEYQILIDSYDRVRNIPSNLPSAEKKVEVRKILQYVESTCGISKSESVIQNFQTFKNFCERNYYLSH